MDNGSHSQYDGGAYLVRVGTFISSNPRKRWSSACAAINSSRFMISLAKETKERSIKSRKRWVIAFAAIRSYRIILSLVKEIVQRNEAQLFSRISPSRSFTVLDINPDAADGGHNYFSDVDQKILTEILKKKSSELLSQLGGVEGIANSLKTDAKNGIHGSEQDVGRRQEAFGSNTNEKRPAKRFFHFVLQALMRTTIMSALLYLLFNIREQGPKTGAYDSGSVFFAIFVIVAVSAVSNYRQSRQFDKLSKVGNNIQVDVVRDGREQNISKFHIVVGEIVFLKIGDQIPADGLFLNGCSLLVDESSITGESNHVEVDCSRNPFLLSGTKVVDVVDGDGARMLVTAVGMNTVWGEMMSSRGGDSSNDNTPLQARIDKITSYIQRTAFALAAIVLIVLLVYYFTGNTKDQKGNPEFKGSKTKIHDVLNKILRIVNIAVTIVVVAVPEGLLLALTIARAYSMKAMKAHQLIARKLSACETMGSVTIICTDKTGTLTLNQMEVTKFWLGEEDMASDVSDKVEPKFLELLRQGVGLNTTGNVTPGFEPKISGSPTEKAILSWGVLKLGMDLEELKRNCTILHHEAFHSEKKRSGVLMRKNAGNTIHVHWKGAAEIILTMCLNYYDCSGDMKSMDESERIKIRQIIQHMADERLRCIAFAHKQILEKEVEYNEDGKTHQKLNEDGKTHQKLNEDGLTLLGIVGLEDPCRKGVKAVVKAYRDAGVEIKMITGDNVFTAKAIAIDCGILCSNPDTNSGEVVEGDEFQNYTPQERLEKVDRIRVMARSSPEAKRMMIQCLKQKGHVVAFIGDGTHDAPALKEADIGLSMGIQGTEVAKESSDIIILGDDFASVLIALSWGRCVYNIVQKFMQFQLTVNVITLMINFVAAVSVFKVPLTAVQFLWVNLTMGTLGALALATQKPTDELMEMRPVRHTAPLITNIMCRNLVAQALYQIVILLILQLKGESVFNVNEKVKDTLVFNTFFFCQVFNAFNARKFEKKNIFKGIHKNRSFLGIMGITIVLQVVIMEFLRRFVGTKVLDWGQWGACIGIAALSWPISWAVKHIPISDEFLSDLRWKKFFFFLSLL